MTTPQNYGAPWRVQPGGVDWLVIDRYGAVVLHCKARGIAEFVVATPELFAALEKPTAVRGCVEAQPGRVEWVRSETVSRAVDAERAETSNAHR